MSSTDAPRGVVDTAIYVLTGKLFLSLHE